MIIEIECFCMFIEHLHIFEQLYINFLQPLFNWTVGLSVAEL